MAEISYFQEITLDLNANIPYSTIVAKQYDSARWLKVYLTKDNIPYPIDARHNFIFRMRKPDGHGIINPAITTIINKIAYWYINISFEDIERTDIYIKTSDNTFEKCKLDDFFELADVDAENFYNQQRYIKSSNGTYDIAGSYEEGAPYYNWKEQQYYQQVISVNPEESYISVQLTDQVLAVAGRGYADIVEYSDTKDVLSTVSFIVNVMASPSIAEAAVSDNQFGALVNALGSATNVYNTATSAAENFVANYMPKISNNGFWELYSASSNDYVLTTNRAVGQDGAPGKNDLIVAVEQGEEGTVAKLETTAVVLPSATYYTNSAFTGQSFLTEAIYPLTIIQTDNSQFGCFTIGDSSYFTDEISISTGNTYYYILTIPKGDTGGRGERGPAGAGGVTWVDDIETTGEYHLLDDEPKNYELFNGNRNFNQISNNSYSYYFDKINNDVDEKIIKYKRVKINDLSNSTTYKVNISKTPEIATDSSYFTITFSNETGVPTLNSNDSLYGLSYIDSGNVRLYAVSYLPQEEFLTYDSNEGIATKELISLEMKKQARANINAFEYFSPGGNNKILFGNTIVPSGTIYYSDKLCEAGNSVGSLLENTIVNQVTIDDNNYYQITINTNNYFVKQEKIQDNWQICTLSPLSNEDINEIINFSTSQEGGNG